MRKQSLPDEIPSRIAFSSLDRGCRTVGTRRRWPAVNRIIRITADAFFFHFPDNPENNVVSVHVRARSSAGTHCSSSRATWNRWITFLHLLTRLFLPFLSCFRSVSVRGLRSGRPTGREITRISRLLIRPRWLYLWFTSDGPVNFSCGGTFAWNSCSSCISIAVERNTVFFPLYFCPLSNRRISDWTRRRVIESYYLQLHTDLVDYSCYLLNVITNKIHDRNIIGT